MPCQAAMGSSDGYSTSEMEVEEHGGNSYSRVNLREPILFNAEQYSKEGIFIHTNLDVEERLYSKEGSMELPPLAGFEDVSLLPGLASCSSNVEMPLPTLSAEFDGLQLSGAGAAELTPILDGQDSTHWNPLTPYSEIEQLFFNLTDNGEIKKCNVKAGNGRKLPLHALIWVEYEMWAEDVEDVIFRTKIPFKFRFFQPNVMTWFDLGVSTMEELETAWFMIQPEFGFGRGIPGIIPQDAKLLFKVHVCCFQETARPGLLRLPGEDLQAFKYREIVACVEELKGQAKCYLSLSSPDWRLAYEKYRKALHFLDKYFVLDAALEHNVFKEVFNLHNNMALCANKMELFDRTRFHCQKALQLPKATHSNLTKLLYRRATAEFGTGDTDAALASTLEAQRYSSYDINIQDLQKRILEKLKVDRAKEKTRCQKMLSFTTPNGNTGSKN